jgi:hypothetical protein
MKYTLCLLLLCLVSAQEKTDNKTIQLFNGKDLSNWTYVSSDPKSKLEDVWSVQDGIIHCKGNPHGYIRTNDDYTSFVLKVQWRFSKPGNSGVLIRCQPPDKVWPKSVECQLQHQAAGDIWVIDKFPIKVAPERTKGRHTTKLHETNEKPIGEWNQYEITADGTHLTLKVNGLVQNEASDFEIKPGKILLQAEGAEIEFRNIELTPIEK